MSITRLRGHQSSPDYFSVLRIPLVAGRVYSYAGKANAARVTVISRSMAGRYWPGGDELGQQIRSAALVSDYKNF
jgi:hypothetical protein